MPDESPPKAEDSAGKETWNDKLARIITQAVVGGGLTAALSSFSTSDLPKIAISGLLGSGVALAIGEPITKKLKQRGGQASEAGVNAIENTVVSAYAKASGAEAKYLAAQKLACQTDRCQGLMQSFVPLLEEIFVDLWLDTSATLAGWQKLHSADPDLVDERMRRGHFQIWQLLQQAEQNAMFRQMAIVAWGGYGKTTLLKHIAYIYSSQQHDRYQVTPRVPVLLALGDCWRKYLSTQETLPSLIDVIEKYHLAKLPGAAELTLPVDWAKNLLKQGKMLVLLDGLDEVPKDKQATVASWINREMQQYGRTKSIFMLTSRPKAYREQAETNRLEMLATLWVEPFDQSQQQQFIQRWYLYQERYANNGRDSADVQQAAEQQAAELVGQIQARSEIQDLAKIPLLLNMIAAFHRLNPQARLPDRRVELYQGICDLQLKHRPGAKALETLLIETDAQKILQRLALEMLLNNREKSFDRPTLLQRLQHHLTAENETANPKQFLEEVVRVSELLVETDADTYEFAHWSFQEYLAAREIWQQKQESLLYERFGELEWKPTILLYAAQVKNPSTLIQAMLDRQFPDLAHACLPETTKQLAPILKQTVKTSYYAKLEALMQAGEWEAADEETDRLMTTTMGKDERAWLRRQDLETFPCADLLVIDRLWVKHSNGKFGFSVQKQIWQECGSPMSSGQDWERFYVRVGWKKGQTTEYVSYLDLDKNPSLSPAGELPCLGYWYEIEVKVDGRGAFRGKNVGKMFLISENLFSRAETCEL
jgi:hypothetical protein